MPDHLISPHAWLLGPTTTHGGALGKDPEIVMSLHRVASPSLDAPNDLARVDRARIVNFDDYATFRRRSGMIAVAGDNYPDR